MDINLTSRTKSALQFTKEITTRWPDRLTGRKACLACADFLEKEFGSFSDQVETQSFDIHPGAFLGYIRINVVLYVLGFIALCLGYYILTFIFGLMAVVIMLSEFMYYKELVDPFFKKRKGKNVYATINPKNGIKQRIIVSAHHDSAHIFNFLEKNAKWFSLRILSGIAFQNLLLLIGLILIICNQMNCLSSLFVDISRIILGVGLIFVPQLWFFYSNKGTPGAGDNMICVASAMEVGKYFNELNKSDVGLRHTQIVIASWDSEECGLRGARAYVKANRENLKNIKTYNFNLESLYDHKSMTFLTSDLNGLVPLSTKMVDECLTVAEELNYSVRKAPFPMLAGGTDAAEMAKAGIEATCLAGMPFEGYGENPSYHTSRDTIEAVDPRAVSMTIALAIGYVLHRENKARSH